MYAVGYCYGSHDASDRLLASIFPNGEPKEYVILNPDDVNYNPHEYRTAGLYSFTEGDQFCTWINPAMIKDVIMW